MTVRCLTEAPSDLLANRLARFERQFRYPLGPGRFFRIVHGRDYSRFFRAMGRGVSFVAERPDRVVGVVGVARRILRLPDGARQVVIYVGDLKTEAGLLGGRAWRRLGSAMRDWALREGAVAAWSVVMDGTEAEPDRYTGRFGLEPFERLADLEILRIPATQVQGAIAEDWEGEAAFGRRRWLALAEGHTLCLDGSPKLRSKMTPQWLISPDGGAVGLLEDTMRAKRLIFLRGDSEDGVEMNVSHLTRCLWGRLVSGTALLRQALLRSAKLGYEAMFVAVPSGAADRVTSALGLPGVAVAPAGVWGYGLDRGKPWCVSTSEI